MLSIMLRRSLPDRGGRFDSPWVRKAQSAVRGRRREMLLPALARVMEIASALLDRREAWQRTREAIASVVILGGVLAVPVACVLAIAGVWMPRSTPLHETGAQMLGFAIVWFMMAVFCAHLRPHPQPEA